MKKIKSYTCLAQKSYLLKIMVAVIFCSTSCTVFCADQATQDWEKLQKISNGKGISELYSSLKDILEDQGRLYAALLKNPENQVSFVVMHLYRYGTTWTKCYGMPQNKYEVFMQKLRGFIGHVEAKILVNDTGLLTILFDLKERSLLQTIYEKIGKENFGKMVALYAPKDTNGAAIFNKVIKSPSEEDRDFIGYWNSLVIESQFDYFLNLLSKNTGDYNNLPSFRDGPKEFFDTIRHLLLACIEKKYDMMPALNIALSWGYYEIAATLIDNAPGLIQALAQENNAVAERLKDFLESMEGVGTEDPYQGTIENHLEQVKEKVEEISDFNSELKAAFEPLKDIKTVTVANLKKAQEAFENTDFSATLDCTQNKHVYFCTWCNKFPLLLSSVQWREDIKDILVLLRTKALEKNITINLEKYTKEDVEAAGLSDIFNDTYVSTRAKKRMTPIWDGFKQKDKIKERFTKNTLPETMKTLSQFWEELSASQQEHAKPFLTDWVNQVRPFDSGGFVAIACPEGDHWGRANLLCKGASSPFLWNLNLIIHFNNTIFGAKRQLQKSGFSYDKLQSCKNFFEKATTYAITESKDLDIYTSTQLNNFIANLNDPLNTFSYDLKRMKTESIALWDGETCAVAQEMHDFNTVIIENFKKIETAFQELLQKARTKLIQKNREQAAFRNKVFWISISCCGILGVALLWHFNRFPFKSRISSFLQSTYSFLLPKHPYRQPYKKSELLRKYS